MKLIVLLIVGVILYFIAKNYKTEKYQNIQLNIKERFDGDLMNHEAGLLVALMAKVAKADGKVCELEVELLKHTLNDISSHFQNSEEIREKLKTIYSKEKESFDNTIAICEKVLKLTKHDYNKRIGIMQYLLNLAFIDKELSQTEYMITEDIANALKIKRSDFEALINKFESFYKNQAQSTQVSLEEAYKTLEASQEDDFSTIKKKYRKLVKQHHPDIIAGQGASKDIIDEATAKLQEVNEAYELIKKDKGQ
ncbi:TerB family tellurite resistance protein [Candidatus Marinarcus aquaticus]|uniref:Molecular chaperone DjlA n=1 Tax=Candidatus Marinarcus aquaticus TaxID=2044504 RepID=A0A4Q0XW57_9BACT|nr:TerB family tellurite resistance protein [Candidatus Marinarcus aquaticus]RXJ60141.1 molecular chaperone DjlA [Candidatus Marinarcus aquaticus]